MFEIRESDINGKGIFATKDISEGTEIGIWISEKPSKDCRYLIKDQWYENYPLGRYCNHSEEPNTGIRTKGPDIVLESCGIEAGQEILTNYWWCADISGFIPSILNQ